MSASCSDSDSEMSLFDETNEEDVHSDVPEIIRLKIEDDDNEVNSYSHKNSLGGLMATDDDDEGFKTPTSPESKIPVPKECPPAPKRKSHLTSVSPTICKRNSAHILRRLTYLYRRKLISLYGVSPEVVFRRRSPRVDDSSEETNRPQEDGDHE